MQSTRRLPQGRHFVAENSVFSCTDGRSLSSDPEDAQMEILGAMAYNV
jgi:hypothetical protein